MSDGRGAMRLEPQFGRQGRIVSGTGQDGRFAPATPATSFAREVYSTVVRLFGAARSAGRHDGPPPDAAETLPPNQQLPAGTRRSAV